MTNLNNALHELREEHKQVQRQVKQLEEAISAIEGLAGGNSLKIARNGAQPGRTISATARRRMARAQKARWTKWRESKTTSSAKLAGKAPVKRILSASGRRKIAAAQRARWARFRARQEKKAA
jgi:hypothetical protein